MSLIRRLWLLNLIFMGLSIAQSALDEEDSRVEKARAKNQKEIHEQFEKAGLPYPPKKIFIRVFKLERSLELWAKAPSGPFHLIADYRVCALSGNLGPKRRQGDHQVPEGFYLVSGFNPNSRFHLSLRLNYPNKSDLNFSDKDHPGGDIFIHGSCVSDGCIAIRNEPIEKVYLIALDARANGQNEIPVQIFPCRMDKFYCQRTLKFFSMKNQELEKFWNSLLPVYEYFEKNKTLPKLKLNNEGYYQIGEK